MHGTAAGAGATSPATLRADGHEVLAPTLSGVAERAHLAPHVDLSTHIAEVAGLLSFHDLHDAVLVGHSYAGLVIAGAAARASARVSRLVYLDAFVADAGQSMFDLLRPERRAVYEADDQRRADPFARARGLRHHRARRRRPGPASA